MFFWKSSVIMLIALQINANHLFAQPLKPFPQHTHYFAGTIKPNIASQQQLDSNVCAFYNAWKKRFVKNKAEEFYILAKDATDYQCVSEGQGYGMLIVVLMAGYDSGAKIIFDGLYRYAKAHPSKRSNYLMAWAQKENFQNARGSDAATDGDMDIAYSLLLADAQWGSNGKIDYLTEAKHIITAIAEQEINHETFSILKGNAIEDATSNDYFDIRSSDFMPAHFKAFYGVSQNPVWQKVIDNNYKLFLSFPKKYSPTTGLLPDFILHINKNPAPPSGFYEESKRTGNYDYNACRVPWRIATDYILYGDNRSKQFLEPINHWISISTKLNPLKIAPGYSLSGKGDTSQDELEKFDAMAYLAPLAVSAMIDKKNQAWLNNLWQFMVQFNSNHFNYYDNTIKMLSMLILSGNYWVPTIR